MMEQTGRRIAGGQRAAESGDGQIALQPVTGGPTDDAARVEVEDHRQIEPALGRPDVGKVRAPFPVRCLGREVLRRGADGMWPFVTEGLRADRMDEARLAVAAE